MNTLDVNRGLRQGFENHHTNNIMLINDKTESYLGTKLSKAKYDGGVTISKLNRFDLSVISTCRCVNDQRGIQ